MSIRNTGWPPFGGNADDLIAIDQLISAYAHTIDSNHFQDCANLFTEDGVLELKWQDATGELHAMNNGKGVRVAGHAARIKFQSTMAGNPPALPRKKPGEGHQLINRIIDVQGDRATARCYRVGGAMQYENELARTPKGWRFKHMLIVWDKDREFPAF